MTAKKILATEFAVFVTKDGHGVVVQKFPTWNEASMLRHEIIAGMVTRMNQERYKKFLAGESCGPKATSFSEGHKVQVVEVLKK